MGYSTVRDASAADWVLAQLTRFDARVADVVPAGFAAYARILHPAHLGETPVTWRQVAAANGRTAHSRMQWEPIVGALDRQEQPGLWDEVPEEDTLPQPLGRRLARVLRGHTVAPEQCWFAVWSGYGGLNVTDGDTAMFETPWREFFLLSGPIDAVHTCSLHVEPGERDDVSVAFSWVVAELSSPDGGEAPLPAAEPEPVPPGEERDPFFQSPNLWWPQDRSWCVATELDLFSTYVGGSRQCVQELLNTPGLEVYEVELADSVSFDGDDINPSPYGRKWWRNR